MNQQIIYKQENNKLALASWSAESTAESMIDTLPEECQYMLIKTSDLPSRADLKDFFEGLQADFDNPDNPNIRIDIEIAREITKNRLRKERIPHFEMNDILLRDAVIENDTEKLARGILERDRLRNITTLPDTANSLEELRNIHP